MIVAAAPAALVCILLSGPVFASDSVPGLPATADEGDVALNARVSNIPGKRLAAAERCFSESIKRNPTVKHYYINLAVTCMRRKGTREPTIC